MPDLPTEIWSYISQFLPFPDLNRLLSLNRLFFYLVLDLRWKHKNLTTAGIITPKTLERLSDPFIAQRVECLSMSLYLEESASSRTSESRRIQPIYKKALHVFRRNKCSGSTPSSRKLDFHEVLETIYEITPSFLNLRELEVISTWSMSPALVFPSLRFLLSTFSNNCGRTLQKLSLHATADELQLMLEDDPVFPSLQHLDFEFKLPSNHENLGGNIPEAEFSSTLVPFVNRLRPHLKTLSLKAYYPVDLSHFFASLGTFPVLTAFDIRYLFNKMLKYPASLVQFFRKNLPALETLHLPLIPSQYFEPDIRCHQILSQWLPRCISDDISFLGLKYLEIFPTVLPVGFDILIAYIQRTSMSLEQIHIRGRYFESHEIPILIDALSRCHNLTALSLSICVLETALFDQMMAKLPLVNTLMLKLENGSSINSAFMEDIWLHDYTSWKLKHLWIKTRWDIVDPTTLFAIRRSVPSLLSLGPTRRVYL